MSTFSLPEGLRIGSASAATQIEGGALDHSWMDWHKKGRVKNNDSPGRANDHYRLWQEDARLMKDLGIQIARMGVEWARIEPREGVFDEEAIRHYVEEIELLNSFGIEPLVTLHHFTNPMWLERKGAFERKENIAYYLRFVEKMVRAFGARVRTYITINEPNVYAVYGYYFGQWPPGEKSMGKALTVMSVLAAAHIQAYGRIHALWKELGVTGGQVSFAHHARVFAPENPKNPAHCVAARLTDRLFQGCLARALLRGEFTLPLRNIARAPRGRYCDFIAMNYYTRSTVAGLGDGVRRGAPVNDLGWEIFPEGIVLCAKALYSLCPLPIYVTENGVCDNNDAFRCRYLFDHLRALSESGLPVHRYYHWCFCDNFEWAEGESARFGIVHVNYDTQQRSVKKSGYFLRELIAAQGVSEELFNQYVKDERYPVNA